MTVTPAMWRSHQRPVLGKDCGSVDRPVGAFCCVERRGATISHSSHHPINQHTQTHLVGPAEEEVEEEERDAKVQALFGFLHHQAQQRCPTNRSDRWLGGGGGGGGGGGARSIRYPVMI
jgi:hypothetical protein